MSMLKLCIYDIYFFKRASNLGCLRVLNNNEQLGRRNVHFSMLINPAFKYTHKIDIYHQSAC